MAELDAPVPSFGSLLQQWRARAGQSGNALARAAGIDPSYLSRLEHGEREPPGRALVLALAGSLSLSPGDTDVLLVAAGHLPVALHLLGALDPDLLLLTGILADDAIPAVERDEFRQVLRLIARRWRPIR